MIGLVLGLGSNMGDREHNLKIAINQLTTHFKMIEISSLYLSKPVDYLNQSDFYNLVARFQVPKLEPLEILKITKSIENEMGRVKKINKGPRNIDIDILFINDKITVSNELTIPHASINQRNFVIFPLRELQSYNEIEKIFSLNENISGEGLIKLKSAKEFLC